MRFPGLTKDESRILVFLFVAFAFGLGVKTLRQTRGGDPPKPSAAEVADASP